MIISFVSTKGGQGKSTLSLCLSYSKTFSKSYDSIGLVEMDVQGTLRSWYVYRSEKEDIKDDKVSFTQLIEKDSEKIKTVLKDTINRNKMVVLDVAGEGLGKKYTQLAMRLSDVVIIPMRTSVNDESSFYDNLIPVIKDVIRENPKRKKGVFYVLPTFVHPTSNPKKVVSHFREIIPDYINILPCCFFRRSVFDDYNFDGNTLLEYFELSKTNQREYEKVKVAVSDIENISKQIIKVGK
jgi:cellulose biosynthesis protein BcsQ